MESNLVHESLVLAKLIRYGINTSIDDSFNIQNLIEDMKLEIITYCNLDDYKANKSLDNILVNLVVFNFLKDKNINFTNNNSDENTSNIKSINVGDFSVSYGASNSTMTNEYISSEINKCYLMLNKFRRVKW